MGAPFTFTTSLVAETGGASHHGPSFLGLMIYLGLVLAILFGLMGHAKKGLGERVFKNPITQLFEQVFIFIEGMCVGAIGSRGRKFMPFIMTLWMVIFTGNVVALFMPTSPTADLSFNVAMALICVGYVQYQGIKQNGLFGHLSHFSGPKLGGLLVVISAMIFVIEIISELMKNVSLSLRLFGNIHGGHMAVEAMNKVGEPFLVPVGAFLLPIKLLTCVVQAMVFTLLTCVYISLVTHDEHDHGSEEHDHGSEAAAAH